MKTKEQMLEENRQLRKKFMEVVFRDTKPLDDVQYNQEWWKWYCNEHKLDVATGKSLRLPIPPNYTLF